MTIRHFKIFISVATKGSVTRAAKELYLSQPTVSVAIRELEDHYGTRLFERINQRLKITEDGEAFLSYVSHIVTLFDSMEREFQNPEVHGTLRVGASVTIGTCYMADIIKTFQDANPEVKVCVQVDSTSNIEKAILSNDLDLAIVGGRVHSPHIQSTVLFSQRHIAVCSCEHAMARQDSIPLETFAKVPMLFRTKNSPAMIAFTNHLLEAGYEVKTVWESTTLEVLVQAVRNNLGVAVLPEKMIEEDLASGRLCKVNIENFEMNSTVSLIHYKNKFISPAIELFTTFVRETWQDTLYPPEPLPEL